MRGVLSAPALPPIQIHTRAFAPTPHSPDLPISHRLSRPAQHSESSGGPERPKHCLCSQRTETCGRASRISELVVWGRMERRGLGKTEGPQVTIQSLPQTLPRGDAAGPGDAGQRCKQYTQMPRLVLIAPSFQLQPHPSPFHPSISLL